MGLGFSHQWGHDWWGKKGSRELDVWPVITIGYIIGMNHVYSIFCYNNKHYNHTVNHYYVIIDTYYYYNRGGGIDGWMGHFLDVYNVTISTTK